MKAGDFIKGSAGGKAKGKAQKEQAQKRINEYNKNPNLCLQCGKPILAPSDKRIKETLVKKFCCRSCASKYNNEHYKKVRNKTLSKIEKFSDEEIINFFNKSRTIKEFYTLLGYNRKPNWNSRVIREKLQSLNLDLNTIRALKKTNQQITKKELFERRSNWQSARSSLQRDARKIYEKSDKPKECAVCGYNAHYEVAHIKAVSDFDPESSISEINDINNLIALCPNHHWEYDNLELDISQFV